MKIEGVGNPRTPHPLYEILQNIASFIILLCLGCGCSRPSWWSFGHVNSHYLLLFLASWSRRTDKVYRGNFSIGDSCVYFIVALILQDWHFTVYLVCCGVYITISLFLPPPTLPPSLSPLPLSLPFSFSPSHPPSLEATVTVVTLKLLGAPASSLFSSTGSPSWLVCWRGWSCWSSRLPGSFLLLS